MRLVSAPDARVRKLLQANLIMGVLDANMDGKIEP